MTIPTFEGGGIPEPVSQPPAQDAPSSVRPYVPKDVQDIKQLAEAFLNIPKGMFQAGFQRVPLSRVIPQHQHQVVTELIAKFNPPLQQFAVLMHKVQPIVEVSKSEQLAPKESGTQRDEASGKGGKTVEQPFVNIEVFKTEKGETQLKQPPVGVPKKEDKPNSETPQQEGMVSSTENEKPLPASKEAVKPEIPQGKAPEPKVKEEAVAPTKAPEVVPQAKKETPVQEAQKPQMETKQPEVATSSTPAMPVQEKQLPQEKNSPKHVEVAKGIEKKEGEKEAQHIIPKAPIETSAHHHGRRHLEEAAIPIMHHKIYQSTDDFTTLPPWLNFLVQNVEDSAVSREGRSGSRKGKERQNPHKLSDMLYMVLCAQLAGKSSLKEIVEFLEKQEPWFKVLLGLKHGLPPRQLMFWFLATLDAQRFEETWRTWLQEVIGQKNSVSAILDIVLIKTSIGFIFGKLLGTSLRSNEAAGIVEGLFLKNSILLLKSEKDYGTLFRQIDRAGGQYIAEWNHPLDIPEQVTRHESYLEGIERVITEEWPGNQGSGTDMRVVSELYISAGVQKSERYYKSNMASPSEEYFDLSRLQRFYEKNFSWLANCALGFPSVSVALERCNASLKNIEGFAKELIKDKLKPGQTVDEAMKEASTSVDYLLELTQ